MNYYQNLSQQMRKSDVVWREDEKYRCAYNYNYNRTYAKTPYITHDNFDKLQYNYVR